MLRTLTYTSILFILWALFSRWYYACYIKGVCCENSSIESRISGLRLTKEGSADIIPQPNALGQMPRYDHFVFNQNSDSPVVNANNQEFLKKTADYLKANPLEKLTISCCHRPNEDANIAELRTKWIKATLLKLGVAETQITTSICKDNDKLLTPAYFAINANNSGGNSEKSGSPVIAEPEKESIFNLNISDENFAFNSANFQPGATFVSQANELKIYVSSHQNVSLSITGHTDNIGSNPFNINLGQRRANAVKAYFRKIGINVKINTTSKGETEPRATNDSEAGRAQNRRVNCRIIQ